jgi:hypothetical protein
VFNQLINQSINQCVAVVTGYVVEKQEEGTNRWEKVPGLVTGTSHTVKGLENGKQYKFRVKAENVYGVGEPLEGNRVTAKNPFGEKDVLNFPVICKQ